MSIKSGKIVLEDNRSAMGNFIYLYVEKKMKLIINICLMITTLFVSASCSAPAYRSKPPTVTMCSRHRVLEDVYYCSGFQDGINGDLIYSTSGYDRDSFPTFDLD